MIGAGLFSSRQFMQSGAAAVARRWQDKAREIASPQDDGAVGDGVAVDTAPVQNAITQLLAVRLPAAVGYKITGLSIPAGARLSAERRQSPINVSGTGGVAIAGDNAALSDLYVNAPGSAQAVYASASASDVTLSGLDLFSDATAAPNGHGVQVNQANCHRWRFVNGRINVYDYGWLVNSTAGGSKNHILANTHITTQVGDAIEFNTPGAAFENVVINGVITEVTAGAGTAQGFGKGFAHVDGVVISGSIAARSYLAAVHVEDGSRNVTIGPLVAKKCQDNGVEVLISGAGGNAANAKAVTVSGCHFEADAIIAGKAGVRIVNDGNGTVYGSTVIGTLARNFESAFWLGGDGSHNVDGAIADSCTYALRCETGAAVHTRITGNMHVVGPAATALLYVSTATGAMVRAGKFICQNKPTNIILKAAPGTTRPGCSVDGFAWPQTQVLTAGATTWVNICPAAATNRIQGQLNLLGRDITVAIANNVWYAAYITWDGAALTIRDPAFENNGALALQAAPALRVNGGFLQVGLFCASAINTRLDVDFEGKYMA